MSSAYWRMLTLLREPENWYPRSILIEMVSTSVFITVLKMTTDRGSHTLSLLSLSRLLLLSRSAHDGRHISYVSTPTETETTHTGHFFLRQGRRRSKGAGDYLGPRTTLAVSRFPFYVRGVVRRFAFSISRLSCPSTARRRPLRVRGIRRETVAFDWKNTGASRT